MDAILNELFASVSLPGTGRPSRRTNREADSASYIPINHLIRPQYTFQQNMEILNRIEAIEKNRQNYDTRRRQLRVLSDCIEDYHHNMDACLQVIRRSFDHPTQSTIFTAEIPLPNQPVIGLTDAEIESATHPTVFLEGQTRETRCPISLEDFQPNQTITRINVCGHVFKTEPLREWFRRNTHCPVCRHNLVG